METSSSSVVEDVSSDVVSDTLGDVLLPADTVVEISSITVDDGGCVAEEVMSVVVVGPDVDKLDGESSAIVEVDTSSVTVVVMNILVSVEAGVDTVVEKSPGADVASDVLSSVVDIGIVLLVCSGVDTVDEKSIGVLVDERY